VPPRPCACSGSCLAGVGLSGCCFPGVPRARGGSAAAFEARTTAGTATCPSGSGHWVYASKLQISPSWLETLPAWPKIWKSKSNQEISSWWKSGAGRGHDLCVMCMSRISSAVSLAFKRPIKKKSRFAKHSTSCKFYLTLLFCMKTSESVLTPFIKYFPCWLKPSCTPHLRANHPSSAEAESDGAVLTWGSPALGGDMVPMGGSSPSPHPGMAAQNPQGHLSGTEVWIRYVWVCTGLVWQGWEMKVTK